MDLETRRRLAIAAPAMQVVIATTLLALVWRPALLIIPVLIALFVLPLVIGSWVFARRRTATRVLLAAWAPAGQAVAFAALVALLGFAGDEAGVALGLLVLVPMLLLLVLGLLVARRPDRSTAVTLGVLWVLAIAEAALAIPLAEYWGGSGGIESLAGTVTLLFAPGIALGAWLALALAARVSVGLQVLEPAVGMGISAGGGDAAQTDGAIS
ncbi:MAG: hypothetical protein RBS17_07910 [Coriobacteriia bacterium]|nr:hypothetical protein [Coriobacteriia bacterium]